MTSDCRSWTSAASLLGPDPAAPVAVLGAPLAERSLTPGRCDLAPKAVRAALSRMSVYDLETGVDLSAMRVFDAGDLDLKLVDPAAAFAPIRDALAPLVERHALTILLGGNNAVTRPAVHALSPSLKRVGLLTLDAHFDLRDTDCGLTNGNPVQALLEDGLPGARIAQIGIAPFANTEKAHTKARAAGIHVATLRQCREAGLVATAQRVLATLASQCDVIHVDFDIDVIDRAQCPGAPGARPGGVAAHEFFDAARAIAAHPKVRSVDLTEFDPSLDVADITSLTAARWFAEILAGVSLRA
ncbi:MAG: agmatinase family protein [Hyphomonadaceae bacterium]|nr:MAG: Formiminoglutamase [Caulobacteraceae bacterium]MBT9445685.1 agmatinase family protein [Hyphomonadaceae bacterium]TPW08332.1 MAG: Formiminoglutamase [Alphaproteobacteria bacterium]